MGRNYQLIKIITNTSNMKKRLHIIAFVRTKIWVSLHARKIRSKVDGPNWIQSGRSFEWMWKVPSEKSGRSKSMKVDSLTVRSGVVSSIFRHVYRKKFGKWVHLYHVLHAPQDAYCHKFRSFMSFQTSSCYVARVATTAQSEAQSTAQSAARLYDTSPGRYGLSILNPFLVSACVNFCICISNENVPYSEWNNIDPTKRSNPAASDNFGRWGF